MKLFRSEAKAIAPPPAASNTVIHQHSPNEVWPLIVKAILALIVTPFVFWHAGVYLLDTAGAWHPERSMALAIIWIAVIAGLLAISAFTWFKIIDKKYARDIALEEERTRQLQYKQLMTQSAVTDSRTSGDMQRLASLIYMIMLDAYDDYAKGGPYTGAWRPWSRRPAGERVLVTLGETAPVGQDFGSKVRPFLERNEVIVGDQLNLKRYPDLSHVQRLLYQPMLLNKPDQWPPSSPPALPANEWSIID